jgi:hypothetical protein
MVCRFSFGEIAVSDEVLGDLIHCKILNRDMLFVNSLDHATELLEKRGGIYCDRPRVPLVEMYVLNSSNIEGMLTECPQPW